MAALAYPPLVYLGLHLLPAPVLVVGLVALLGLRLILGRGTARPYGASWWIAGVGALLLVAVSPLAGLKAYPVLVNLALAAAFGWSLWRSPTVVERIARLREPDLPPEAIPYLRKVTLVWLLFFVANGTVSTLTALSGSLELWTLYNGFIAYLLIGALFLGELIVRRVVRRRAGAVA